MSSRIVAMFAAAALAPAAAFAQETQGAAPAVDPAIVEGKVDSLSEQYAETKVDVEKLKKLSFSGYVQGRWSWLENATYETGAPARDNFYVRRARLKAAYSGDMGQLVIQLDAAPDKTALKEGYARLKLPSGMSLDVGLQLLPFGYEVGVVSSSGLDLLERSSASGRWLKGEYDVGAALNARFGAVSFRGGLFNGNGVDGANGKDNDQRKDVIGRLAVDLGVVTGGLSGWYGKVIDYTSATNKVYDRTRYGADVQVFLDLLPVGGTAVKAEYLMGTTAIGTGAGGGGDALGVKGYGWYGTLLQSVGLHDQVAVRYQQYVADKDLDLAANPTKVKSVNEVSVAYHHYFGDAIKLSLAYYHPMNGDKGATASTDPKADNVTAQLQAKF